MTGLQNHAFRTGFAGSRWRVDRHERSGQGTNSGVDGQIRTRLRGALAPAPVMSVAAVDMI
jgi:hypothetical protein